jgi:ATP-binding cassette, subfamily B, bacterial
MDPDGPWSPYEPPGADGAVPRAPKARVHPDRSFGWLRRVWPMLRARRWAWGLSLLGALVALLCGVAIPRITMGAIDQALVAKSHPLAPYLWVIGGLAVVRAGLTYAYRSTLYKVAYDLEYDLRTTVYGHLTRLSFSFYDRVQSGQLISRANSDIRSVQMFTTFAPLLALNFVSFGVAIVLMLSINVGLTLVAVFTLPFTFMASMRLRNVIFPMSWIVQARSADIATIVDEDVQGVRVVKGFAAEEREVRKLARSGQRLQWANVILNDARARWGPLIENLPRFGLVGVLLYGGWLAIEGKIGVGAIVAFNAYVVMLQAPFRFLSLLLLLGQRASASAKRIFEILDEEPDVVDHPGAVDLVDSRGEIELRDVVFGYGDDEPILDGCSLRVNAGEIVAVVGRTGSGKSTLARLVPRFYDVRSGVVLVDGRDVRDVTLASLRHHVGVVLDEPFLFSDTIRANIAFGRTDATDHDIAAAAAAAQASTFIEALPAGYDTVIGERGYDLSGGQRQRLALARTLLVDPAVLVLDDATSAIDVQVEAAIHDALTERRRGRTTLVIAHRLSTIALADRVVLLEGGRVVASGTHAELLATEPRYAAVLARVEAEEAELVAADSLSVGGA